MALRHTPFHRVLHRPQLLWGCDRECALFCTVVAVTLPALLQDMPAFVAGALIWALAFPVLRWAAKQDPQWRQVYMQQRHYRKFYPARSTPYRDATLRPDKKILAQINPAWGEKVWEH